MAPEPPTTHVQVGTGIDPASIDYALDRFRTLCEPHSVTTLDVRMRRTDHPAMPTAVMIDVSADVHGRTLRVRAVRSGPHASVDDAAERLADRLQASCQPAHH